MDQHNRLRAVLLATSLLWILAVSASMADTVVKGDGREMDGDVISVDETWVVLRSSGNNLRIKRSDVAAIRFDRTSSRPPLKVEIRNVRSSDAIDVLLDDQVVIRDAQVGGSWVDLTARLKSGNNLLRFRIRNEQGGWGYHLQLRINGEVQTLGCGKPPRFREPCTCCGKLGNEKGVIDDLPPLWIYFDDRNRTAELLR